MWLLLTSLVGFQQGQIVLGRMNHTLIILVVLEFNLNVMACFSPDCDLFFSCQNSLSAAPAGFGIGSTARSATFQIGSRIHRICSIMHSTIHLVKFVRFLLQRLSFWQIAVGNAKQLCQQHVSEYDARACEYCSLTRKNQQTTPGNLLLGGVWHVCVTVSALLKAVQTRHPPVKAAAAIHRE